MSTATANTLIDTEAVPSVRARLAELKLQQSNVPPSPTYTSYATPSRARSRPPPPPPPPTEPPKSLPKQTKSRPPPPPPPTTAPKKPPLPIRKSVANGIVPPPPVSKPALPTRRGTNSSTSSRASIETTRSLPPTFTGTEALPVQFAKKEPTPTHSRSNSTVSTRSIPSLPSRSRTSPNTTSKPSLPTRSSTTPVLPPPAISRRTLPPPDAPVPKPPSVKPITSPPPVPTSTRPPPVPTASRPDPSTLAAVPSAPCLSCMDFTFPDSLAAQPHLQRSAQPPPTIRSLAAALCGPFPNNPTMAARAVYVWLHHNISYDAVGLNTKTVGPQDGESVLHSGKSVCEGYAKLFAALCTAGGVTAEVVGGHGKGAGYKDGDKLSWPPSGHAWNAFYSPELGGWHQIDACWGAGHVCGNTYTRRWAPEFFVSNAREFGKRHFPRDEQWRESAGDWTWDDYEGAPARALRYGKFSQLGLGALEPATNDLGPMRGTTVTVRVAKGDCGHKLVDGSEGMGVLFVDIDGDQTPLEVEPGRTGWSARVKVPRGARKMSLCRISKWDGRTGDQVTLEMYRRQKGRVSSGWEGVAAWGVDK